jgi:hypothetical protein
MAAAWQTMLSGRTRAESHQPSAALTVARVLEHQTANGGGQRAICIAADDFGLHSGINRAVLQLADQGTVNAIGCMVGTAAWPAGSRWR